MIQHIFNRFMYCTIGTTHYKTTHSLLKMPEWLGISDMSNVSHTLANWELSLHMLYTKHWKDSSQLASVC